MKENDTFLLLNAQRTFIMGISIISIMLFHQQWLGGGVFDFFRSIGHWGVDVFLFLSGYGIAKSLDRNTLSRYFKNRTKRILPTCLLIGVVTLVADFIIGRSIDFVSLTLLCKLLCLNYWFIVAIWIYYLVAPLLNKLPSAYSSVWALFSVIMVVVCILFFDDIPLPYNWCIWRFPVFCVGFFFYKGRLEVGKLFYILGGVSLISICLLIIYDVLTPGSWQTYIVIIPFIQMLSLLLGYIPQFMIQTILVNTNDAILLCGRMSLQLYLAHSLVFGIFQHYFPGYEGLRLFAGAFFISFILAYSVYKLTEFFKSEHPSFYR